MKLLDLNGEIVDNVNSLSLYFDKFVFYKNRKKRNERKELKKILNLKEEFKVFFQNSTRKKLIDNARIMDNLFKKVLKQMKSNNFWVFEKKYSLISPLLIGSGLPSIYEVGIYINRNYGLPVIPGQAIKGAFSAYLSEIEKEDILFTGSNDSASEIYFFDAIPVDFEFGIDILNPHFNEYYQNGKIPNDVYMPVPIHFLSVFKGDYIFRFYLTKEVDEIKAKEQGIKEYFEKFLNFYGIGSKTSMGYGRFKN